MKKRELQDFESHIASLYEKGKIRAPIHLSGGNETKLIRIFKEIKKGDWIFSTHRSHLHYLLAGGSPQKLEEKILSGHSMHIFDSEIPFFSSSIVAGICPIALGVALGLKRKRSKKKTWCFVGDMAGETGLFHECVRYAEGHNLPITFIVEDNGVSVKAPTQKVWGQRKGNKVLRYKYKNKYPHAGIGKWVTF